MLFSRSLPYRTALLALSCTLLVLGIQAQGREDADKEAPHIPPPDARAAEVPPGYRVEVAVKDLTYPTSVEFDGAGNMYVAEGGYIYGDDIAPARIFRVSPQGSLSVAAEQLSGPVTDLLWHGGRLYISHRGKISGLEGGQVRDLVAGLPSWGDHHNNQLTAGPDGKLYLGQGTATNSGVVGLDNYKMGWLSKHAEFHDVPARDLRLRGQEFRTTNPLTLEKPDQVQTSAFHPFGKTAPQGAVVRGQTKASGTILRFNPDGSGLEVYAWGLRNPFGIMWGPGGKLYCSENGFDVRGSRPVANAPDNLWVIRQGAWYGWPDFASGIPITDPRFRPKEGPAPQFLMQDHPPVEQPFLTFAKHAAVTKLDFSPSDRFGYQDHLFLALWGHMAPMTGTVEEHGGHRVVRIDPATKRVETFFSARGHERGGHGGGSGGARSGRPAGQTQTPQGGGHGTEEVANPGPKRPVDVRFSPRGDALYVVDTGAFMVVQSDAGPMPRPFPGTGVVWRVTRKGTRGIRPPGGLSILSARAGAANRRR